MTLVAVLGTPCDNPLRQAVPITWEGLALWRSRATCTVLAELQQMVVRGMYQVGGAENPGEAIEIRVYPEISGKPVNCIEPIEPVLIIFRVADRNYPEVYALRENFDRGLPHLNNHNSYALPQLCLYSDRWVDYKAIWTPLEFLHRIYSWFTRTADGTLYDPIRNPEPLVLPAGDDFIFDAELVADGTGAAIGHSVTRDGAISIVASLAARRDPMFNGPHTRYFVVSVVTQEVRPSSIRAQPSSLAELEELIGGSDPLHEQLRDQVTQRLEFASTEDRLVLLVTMPIAAQHQDEPKRTQTVAFVFNDTIGTVYKALDRPGAPVRITPVNPIRTLGPRHRAQLSGVASAWAAKRFVAIGAGALGSSFLDQMARMGLGTWWIIDHDHLLPHNLTRHTLAHRDLGEYKASACAAALNAFDNEERFKAVTQDYFDTENRDELRAYVRTCSAIVDLTGSVAVARHLASGLTEGARRACGFCTPSGRDGVFMIEDEERTIRLDALEAQYYRWILASALGSTHLDRHVGNHRYGGSCRDVTTIFAADLASVHASLIALNFRTSLAQGRASAKVWHIAANGDVTSESIEVAPCERAHDKHWTIVYDGGLQERLSQRDVQQGHVLGYWDCTHRSAYVVNIVAGHLTPEQHSEIARRTANIVGPIGRFDRVEDYADTDAPWMVQVPGTPLLRAWRTADGRLDWCVHETLV